VVVVLCPTFVAGFDENWFHLLNLVTNIDVVYVLYDGLNVTTITEQLQLNEAIRASIRNSPRLTWSWPVEDDAERGLCDKLDIALFWCHLKLAIPNRRRRTCIPAGVDPLLPAVV